MNDRTRMVMRRGTTLLLLAGAVTQAHAVPMLRLTTGLGTAAETSIAIEDGGVGDWSASGDGAVVFIGALDGWEFNVTTGLSKPTLGSADFPVLDLNSVNVSSAYGGTLRIELTDTDFLLAGPWQSQAKIGGVTDGTISYRTYYDAGNAAFGQSGVLHDLGSFTRSAFSSTDGVSFIAPELYSLTLLVDIMHSAPRQASSFNATVSVPEPSSIALLGAGLLALGFAGRGRRAHAKSAV